MQTPARILRALAHDKNPEFFALTPRQREREENFITLATCILANVGTQGVTFATLATGLRTGVGTLRFHFPDLHVLLAEILNRHLRALAQALARVPQNAPNRRDQLRAAYLAHTRSPSGALTDPHRLLVRDRHTLPAELLADIELTRNGLALLLAGDRGEQVTALLDNPALDPVRIEGCAPETPTAPPRPPPACQPPTLQMPTLQAPAPPACTYSPSFPPLIGRDPTAHAEPGFAGLKTEESISFLEKRSKKLLLMSTAQLIGGKPLPNRPFTTAPPP